MLDLYVMGMFPKSTVWRNMHPIIMHPIIMHPIIMHPIVMQRCTRLLRTFLASVYQYIDEYVRILCT